MKKTLVLLFLSTFFLTIYTSCSREDYGDILATASGYVIYYENDSAHPLNAALVTMSPGGLNTYTGIDGYFEFKDVDANQYTLEVQKNGFKTNRITFTLNPGETRSLSLVMRRE